VPVVDGHTLTVSIAFEQKPAPAAIAEALRAWRGRPQELRLPSAPAAPIEIEADGFRPQPRLDLLRGRGMAVTVGRIRPCPVLGTKFVAMGHNTVRGAAGAAILNAELMQADGWLEAD
jgi:aspartate-semialdehyde dehydrogenase